MENQYFKILDEIIVRSPIYTYKRNVSIEDIYAIIENEYFLEALYIASPTLFAEILKLKNGEIKTEKEKEKLIKPLFRYYYRMCTRSTPFGLFSTCGVLTWGDEDISETDTKLYRHTRLDMLFLQNLVGELSKLPEINQFLKYHSNNSIYVVDSEIRYMEYSYQNGFRQYTISAVTTNDYILKVLELSNQGISQSDLVKKLGGISEADAQNLISNMINSQLLVSEFEVAPNHNDDFGKQLIAHLTNIYQRSESEMVKNFLEFLKSVFSEIKELDNRKTNVISRYEAIIAKLKLIYPSIDESKTFHIDSYRTYNKAKVVREGIRAEILELIGFFVKMNGGLKSENAKMTAFKNKFIARYDTQTMPLVEVLDEDFGIGYPVDRRLGLAPLVDDIPLGQGEIVSTLSMNKIDKWLGEIMKDAQAKRLKSIDISQFSLPKSNNLADDFSDLPLSFSTIFRVMNDPEQTLIFEGFVGPSASSILARFAYGNSEIHQTIGNIIEEEEKNIENGILAEIVHVPDNRVTNVIAHPSFRKYEIPYLAEASNQENTIDVNDLMVKIENNELILFSEKMNKRIIPCKTNMHNHVFKALPMYHFLTDLQSEIGKRIFNFSWGSIIGVYSFLPRVYYKKTIISPATWNLSQPLLESLKSQKEETAIAAVRQMKKDFEMPDLLLFVEGDNELLLDFNNELSIQIWLNLIKNKPFVFLKEFLWNTENKSEKFINQYVASVINTQKKQFPTPSQLIKTADLISPTRELRIGESNWIYLKLYCGSGSADMVLLNTVLPILQDLNNQGLINKWFFIKYHDTDYHLRVRIELKNVAQIASAFKIINQQINEDRNIWKVLPDNYMREIERYGANSIECCESLFFIDSEMSVELLYHLQLTKSENMIFWWALRLVDEFLNAFGLNIEEKIDFSELLRKSFQQEFNTDKKSKDSINSKYNLALIKEIMANDGKHESIVEILNQKIIRQMPFIKKILNLKNQGELLINFNSLLASLIHMKLNRLITNKERLHEFLVYEFLYKYYQMKIRVDKMVEVV